MILFSRSSGINRVMSDVEGLDYAAFLLTVVGAVNWGLVGLGLLATGDAATALADFNLVHLLLGNIPVLEAVVYLLVGVAGVLDGLGVTGGYGILSDERSIM